MQTFTKDDLEAILLRAKARAPEQGVSPTAFENVYRTVVADIEAKKTSDVKMLYDALQTDMYFLDSVQMAKKRKGEIKDLQLYEGTLTIDYRKILDDVDRVFGTQWKRQRNEPEHKVYIWLQRLADGRGILQSYGNAHVDGSNRTNSHYFVVVGSYDKLERVTTTFVENPANLSQFVATVFLWKNQKVIKTMFYQNEEPDLFTRMKELYISAPGKDIVKVPV